MPYDLDGFEQAANINAKRRFFQHGWPPTKAPSNKCLKASKATLARPVAPDNDLIFVHRK